MKKAFTVISFFAVILTVGVLAACNINSQPADSRLNGNWNGGGVSLTINGSTYMLRYIGASEQGTCTDSGSSIRFMPNTGTSYTCNISISDSTMLITYPSPSVNSRPSGTQTLTKLEM